MKIIRTKKSLIKEIQKVKSNNKSIGFVPTMGALHKGHSSLMQKAWQENDSVVVSIFVNPAQFGPNEDFKEYPRNTKQDISFCIRNHVDIIFIPSSTELYAPNYRTFVTVDGLSNLLCGKFRPGHFRGVATIVTKLLNLVRPDTAYFGQKDIQQATIIKKLALDLNFPVKIKVMPTIRDNDGLALSSRNIYLSPGQRQQAQSLYKALKYALLLIKKGQRNSTKIIHQMRKFIAQSKPSKIDYISIVDFDNLNPLKLIKGKCVIALAVWFGKTRLIDNMIVTI